MGGCAAGLRTIMCQREAWRGCLVEWFPEKPVRPSNDAALIKVDMPYSSTHFWVQSGSILSSNEHLYYYCEHQIAKMSTPTQSNGQDFWIESGGPRSCTQLSTLGSDRRCSYEIFIEKPLTQRHQTCT